MNSTYALPLSQPSVHRRFGLGWCQTSVILLGLALLGPTVVQAQYRVLFIGNSFTLGSGAAENKTSAAGGVPGLFNRLARAGGQPTPTVVMRAVGGQDYLFHSQDATTQAAITSQPWTHVVLQNYSTEPTHLVDGTHSLAHHFTYGAQLQAQVLAASPQAQVVLYQTWSRAQAHPLISGVSSPSSFASTTEFQAELRTNYQALADSLNAAHPSNPPVAVAPVGTAWENAGGLRTASDPFFVPLHSSDNYHGNDNGYYLAACVFYSTIYRVSPFGLSTNTLITSLNLHLTVSATFLEQTAWDAVSGTNQQAPQEFLLDFGSASAPTTNGPAPHDPIYHWNQVTETIGASPTGQVINLVTTSGAATDIGLAMLSPFNGVNENGTLDATILPVNATRDSLYGNTELFNGKSNLLPSFKLSGLDPLRAYSFTFYASRIGATDNRETRYTVTGRNAGAAALNAANNVDGAALVAGIFADASGEITLQLSPTANNNSPYHFTYLGALRIDAVPRQEPIVFTRHPADVTVPEGQAASFTAAVQGTPPYFVQWFTNGLPVPNAKQFSCTFPMVSTNQDGLVVSVTVSNLAFGASSSNGLLHVTPSTQTASAQSLLFDFGGSNTTGHGPSPDDPTDYWNNVTTSVGASDAGRLTNLVTTANAPTAVGLVMLSRFNGANENGTTSWPLLPQNATRDSLYGNTESFNGLVNIFPRFKLAGLNPAWRYTLTFYASRTGTSDNRETSYTVVGAATNLVTLNPANNTSSTGVLSNLAPSAAQELTIRIAPAAANNNANHFTYLGVLRLDAVLPTAAFGAPFLENGRLKLDWSGSAQLQWASNLTGPWLMVAPQPEPPFWQSVIPGENRFFRLVP